MYWAIVFSICRVSLAHALHVLHDLPLVFQHHLPCRFFMFWAIVFVTHQVGVCIFRCTAMISRNIVVANGLGMLLLLCCILLDGFVIVKRYIHPWVVW